MEFDTVAKLVKLNDESLAVVKSQLPKHGIVVVLHDGKQFKADKLKADNEAKAQAQADAKEKEEAKAEAEKTKDDELKKQAEEIEELKKQLASKPKVENVKEEAKAEAGAEETPKKANGKG